MSTTEDSPFTKCDDCGTIFVQNHKCGADTTRGGGLTVERREELSNRDDGDPDDTVVYLRGRSDTSYHEPENPDDPTEGPACHAQLNARSDLGGPARKWSDTTRQHARDNTTHHPCRWCHDLGGDSNE